MLRPIIMIGCGGAGNKVVRNARDAVERQLKRTGWDHGVPQAWQFIGIDSNRQLEDPSIPFLPEKDYVNIAGPFSYYQELNSALEAKFGPRGQRPDSFKEFLGWRPNPTQVQTPLDRYGQYLPRSTQRIEFLVGGQERIRERLGYAFNQCVLGTAELQEISEGLGFGFAPETSSPAPIVLIVGSTAGSTGAGIMLDVVDLVRAIDVNGAFPTLVALMPDVFGSVLNDAMTANSAAFMSELVNAYWDRETPEPGIIPPNVQVHTRGPHSVYVIGRRNLDGLDLFDSRNVYRAVGKVLAAVTTSIRVQQDFYQYQTVDWANRAAVNAGGYGFANQHLPGVASSFGSATISIGRDRFRDYIRKLLHRSIIEQLVDGFEAAAVANFGETEAKSMATPTKVTELARRNSDNFMLDCGLTHKQIGDSFVSNDVMKAQHGQVANLIKAPFQTVKQQAASTWFYTIMAQAQQTKVSSKQKADAEVNDRLQQWSSEVYRRVLRTSTEFSASLSIPVVLTLIEIARADALKTASELREKAKEDRTNAAHAEAKARTHLANQKGNVRLSSSPVQETVNDISKAIVWEWTAGVREKLSAELEAVATSMLTSIEVGLRNSYARISTWVAPQDGRPPIVATWPKNTNEVPASFAPSPVEFFLEDYTAWPQYARELIQQSLGARQGLPTDPIEAARTLIIRGGFGGTGNGHAVSPLIWGEGYGSEPEWEAGHVASIKVDDSIEGLGERIDAWLSRPATEVNRVLTEGLATYLSPDNPITGAPVANHLKRLKVFREKLQLALMTSRPLIEIDQRVNAVVHPRPTSCSLNIGGFPFGEGHPARQSTEEIIQGFLGTSEPVDWAFTPRECETVLVSSFLNYPVNPSAMSSFTEPLAGSVNHFSGDLLRSAFWQWRRACTLQKFVPLPYELRLAAIRGFAIARAIGVMSAEVQRQNVIADRDGDKFFPKHLLTLTDRNNLLPALLEAMVLTFAEVSTKGKDAFAAYESLIKYGTGEGIFDEIQVGGLVEHFLDTGEYDGVRIVDQDRANSVVGIDRYQRAEKIIEYLQRNIERFEDLERSGPDPQSWRNQIGDMNPIDTLTHELLTDLRNAYGQVLDAVRKWQSPSQYLV